MTSAFYQAGFSPWDITMNDLIRGRMTLDRFRGLVAVGGFSYADVPESAKGWAAAIRFNERLRKMFDDFYHRSDTFSLGVCNVASSSDFSMGTVVEFLTMVCSKTTVLT
jgi:phosphoribosylformylglycinamidine synthase